MSFPSFGQIFNKVVEGIQYAAGPLYRMGKDLYSVGKYLYDLPSLSEFLKFQAEQAGRGFQAVITFPFSVFNMIFKKDSRWLLKDIFKYNLAYYLFIVLGYQGLMRKYLEEILGEESSLALMGMDMLAYAIFYRSLINTYIINTVNNMNAGQIRLEGTDLEADLPTCEHGTMEHIKANVLAPCYYGGKMLILGVFSQTPYVWPITEFIIKPHVIGESLLEIKLSGLCHDCRVPYLAKRNAPSIGMGWGLLLSAKMIRGLVNVSTGVDGFFVDDAIMNCVYPIALSHMHNTKAWHDFREGPGIDLYKGYRQEVNRTVESIAKEIVPRILSSKDKGRIVRLILQAWHYPVVRGARYTMLYYRLHHSKYEFVRASPVRLLILNNQALLAKIVWVASTMGAVGEYRLTVRFLNFLYSYTPLVPYKSEVDFIAQFITKDAEQLKKGSALALKLLTHATTENVIDEADWIRIIHHLVRALKNNPGNELNIIDNYDPHEVMGDGGSPVGHQQTNLSERAHLDPAVRVDESWVMVPGPNPSAATKGWVLIQAEGGDFEIIDDYAPTRDHRRRLRTQSAVQSDTEAVSPPPPLLPSHSAPLRRRRNNLNSAIGHIQSDATGQSRDIKRSNASLS